MNGDSDFVRSLAEYLALHTVQPSGYLRSLIGSFLEGRAHTQRTDLEPSVKAEMAGKLATELEAHRGVPSFLEGYLLRHLKQGAWPPEAAMMATRYLRRHANGRFVPWRRRQQIVSAFFTELIPGTELGFRQYQYSQGAGPVFRWRGIPCFKTNCDFAIYTMLIDELKPGTIIELGAGAGGSSLCFADLCTALGLSTQVISIDTAAAEFSDPRITFVCVDCCEWLAATAKSKPGFAHPYLMIEDFHGDLYRCFSDIDLILQFEDYLVVEDSFLKQDLLAKLVADRPYLVDSKYTDFFGTNCTSAINSIFVKRLDASASPLRILAAERRPGSFS